MRHRIFWTTVGSLLAIVLPAPAAYAEAPERATVIVRAQPGAVAAAKAEARRLGGRVVRDLRVIDGFTATLPARALPALRRTTAIVAVTPDAPVRLFGGGKGGTSSTWALGYDEQNDKGSLLNIAKIVKAVDAWKAGYTGKGVDVALIDSGVVPVEGLTSGNVVLGPDLSFESQFDEARHLDTYGHGTHMASIIVGRDRVGTADEYASGTFFTGIAPDARLVSIKVAAANGAVDVSQVIAAIDWVVQHRNADGLNIRVLNLSFGTDATQDYRLDPLAYAAEVAMRSGIVVVAAMGNDGNEHKTMANPAYHPAVLAAGSIDTKGSASTTDDEAPLWATKGNSTRGADVGAPAVSVIGLRAPGSYLDQQHPGGRLGERFFRGSGSSQAAAITSAAAALLVQRFPTASAFTIKEQLRAYPTAEPYISSSFVGKGLVDVHAAQRGKLVKEKIPELGTGTGSLEGSRGSVHLSLDGVELTGEQDIMGMPFVSGAWATEALAGSTWTGGAWNGSTWTGSTWTSSSWFGTEWQGSTWTGSTWTGSTWTGSTWTGSTWTGSTWTGSTWTGSTWTGSTWTGDVWATGAWG